MGLLWKIHLLGGLRVVRVSSSAAESSFTGGNESPSTVIERFRTQKTGALLAYLAYHPQSHVREVVGELIWPASEPGAGSQSLRTALSSLRRQLEPLGVPAGTVLITTRTTVQLNPQTVGCDARDFQFACHQAHAAPIGTEEKIALLERAVELYTGPLLPGYYEEWISGTVRELEEEYFSVLHELLGSLEANGHLSRALHFARIGARHDSTRPEIVEVLDRLTAEIGGQDADTAPQKPAARRPRRRKTAEPSPALADLPSPLPPPLERRSNPGDRRRNHIDLPGEHLPFNSAPVVLPAILDRFFGRENEINTLCEEMNRGTRLLTLTGAGGSGKTRLAIESAHQFVNGRWNQEQAVFYVPLADVRDGHHLIGVILETLALPRARQLLSGLSPESAPFGRLCAALKARPTLLVLDNFEHLTATGAPFVQALLERVPTLQILVTSQQRLVIHGGREIGVSGLPFPAAFEESASSPEEMLSFAAVQLFVERAQSVAPDFGLTRHNAAAIGEICRRLEGVPLALELAAARAGAFAPAQIASRLASVQEKAAVLTSIKRPATPRHFSLHAAITWSYELLPPDLARFWTRLSVFRGGFTLEAAQTVCEELSAAHQLSQLRASSLLNVSEFRGALRFYLPELLREYAGEKLHDEPNLRQGDAAEALRLRHARYYNDLLATYSSSLRTEYEVDSLAQAIGETENARVGLEWAVGNPSPENRALAASLALSLGMCLQRRGLHGEALEIVEKGMSILQPTDKEFNDLRLALLREHSGLSLDLMKWEAARTSAAAMLALCRKRRNLPGVAAAMNLLGLAAKGLRDWKAAREYFSSALEQFQTEVDIGGQANVYNNLGLIEYLDDDGDKDAAAHHLSRARRLRRAMNDRRSVAEAHINLGALAQQSGQLTRARRHYLVALRIETELEHIFGVGRALCNLGEIAEEQGESTLALRLYMAARVLFEEAGIAYQQYTTQRLTQLSNEVEIHLDEVRDEARRLMRDGALAELAKWPIMGFEHLQSGSA